ncbi:MAG: sensor histidine kinase, partial [Lachnospiraceae bacterium]|nr:sensor histidine kinase [Lachnospiraceae bacterium]
LMRAELKKARQAEAEANAGKKELVAKLSHDIKTPVASIKAASEVGAAIAEQEKIRDNYRMIIQKADQINTLINNLFTATLEELQQLPVNPEDIRSEELATLLKNADYLHRAVIPAIPDCILYADRLRLQQVFDNLFANSYKYAGTRIMITVREDGGCLTVEMEDSGGGVGEDELPLLKEKFRRGSNAANVEGAGLGLYISDYFLKEMGGGLVVQNGEKGLRVSVRIALSGREVTLNSYTFPLAEQSVLRF